MHDRELHEEAFAVYCERGSISETRAELVRRGRRLAKGTLYRWAREQDWVARRQRIEEEAEAQGDATLAGELARRRERGLQIIDAALAVLVRLVPTLTDLEPPAVARELRAYLGLEQALLPAPAESELTERPVVFDLHFGTDPAEFDLPVDDGEARP